MPNDKEDEVVEAVWEPSLLAQLLFSPITKDEYLKIHQESKAE